MDDQTAVANGNGSPSNGGASTQVQNSPLDSELRFVQGAGIYDGTSCEAWPQHIDFEETGTVGMSILKFASIFRGPGSGELKTLSDDLSRVGVASAEVFSSRGTFDLRRISTRLSETNDTWPMAIAHDQERRVAYAIDNTFLCGTRDLAAGECEAEWCTVTGLSWTCSDEETVDATLLLFRKWQGMNAAGPTTTKLIAATRDARTVALTAKQIRLPSSIDLDANLILATTRLEGAPGPAKFVRVWAASARHRPFSPGNTVAKGTVERTRLYQAVANAPKRSVAIALCDECINVNVHAKQAPPPTVQYVTLAAGTSKVEVSPSEDPGAPPYATVISLPIVDLIRSLGSGTSTMLGAGMIRVPQSNPTFVSAYGSELVLPTEGIFSSTVRLTFGGVGYTYATQKGGVAAMLSTGALSSPFAAQAQPIATPTITIDPKALAGVINDTVRQPSVLSAGSGCKTVSAYYTALLADESRADLSDAVKASLTKFVALSASTQALATFVPAAPCLSTSDWVTSQSQIQWKDTAEVCVEPYVGEPSCVSFPLVDIDYTTRTDRRVYGPGDGDRLYEADVATTVSSIKTFVATLGASPNTGNSIQAGGHKGVDAAATLFTGGAYTRMRVTSADSASLGNGVLDEQTYAELADHFQNTLLALGVPSAKVREPSATFYAWAALKDRLGLDPRDEERAYNYGVYGQDDDDALGPDVKLNVLEAQYGGVAHGWAQVQDQARLGKSDAFTIDELSSRWDGLGSHAAALTTLAADASSEAKLAGLSTELIEALGTLETSADELSRVVARNRLAKKEAITEVSRALSHTAQASHEMEEALADLYDCHSGTCDWAAIGAAKAEELKARCAQPPAWINFLTTLGEIVGTVIPYIKTGLEYGVEALNFLGADISDKVQKELFATIGEWGKKAAAASKALGMAKTIGKMFADNTYDLASCDDATKDYYKNFLHTLQNTMALQDNFAGDLEVGNAILTSLRVDMEAELAYASVYDNLAARLSSQSTNVAMKKTAALADLANTRDGLNLSCGQFQTVLRGGLSDAFALSQILETTRGHSMTAAHIEVDAMHRYGYRWSAWDSNNPFWSASSEGLVKRVASALKNTMRAEICGGSADESVKPVWTVRKTLRGEELADFLANGVASLRVDLEDLKRGAGSGTLDPEESHSLTYDRLGSAPLAAPIVLSVGFQPYAVACTYDEAQNGVCAPALSYTKNGSTQSWSNRTLRLVNSHLSAIPAPTPCSEPSTMERSVLSRPQNIPANFLGNASAYTVAASLKSSTLCNSTGTSNPSSAVGLPVLGSWQLAWNEELGAKQADCAFDSLSDTHCDAALTGPLNIDACDGLDCNARVECKEDAVESFGDLRQLDVVFLLGATHLEDAAALPYACMP